ncbi:hypothetical protein [Rhizobium sp. Leaf383]|uniref:hypothetical protein n=1 Tax=Rhizobium sp. Leaf383 TaxID=1736357 RepID=UPI0007130E92|nr:hypothetical protein [Rhizobium sp. Leaf383]KQS75958.1 hypothetical protein ASG58_14120 [Rhizobium sp. Leaf383]
MNKDIEQLYRKRAEEFKRSLPNQATGATSMVRGYDFQEMVSLFEVLRIGRQVLEAEYPEGNGHDIVVQQDGLVGVDDLVIVSKFTRRHIQIKSGLDPSWLERLVDAIWADYFEHHNDRKRNLSLEVCVGSLKAKEKMEANKSSHHLDEIGIRVFHEDVDRLPAPYLDPEIYDVILVLSHVPHYEGLHKSLWSAVWGGWRDAGRAGDIETIFDHISTASRFTTKSLRGASYEQEELVRQLNENIEELSFSADGDKFIVTDLFGQTLVPNARGFDWDFVLKRFTGRLPESLEEFEEAVGSRKARIWETG